MIFLEIILLVFSLPAADPVGVGREGEVGEHREEVDGRVGEKSPQKRSMAGGKKTNDETW